MSFLSMKLTNTRALATLAGLAVLATCSSSLTAQSSAPGAGQKNPTVVTGNPQRDNFAKLTRTISVDFTEAKLEDVIKNISDQTGAEFEPIWKGEGVEEGLDKEQLITLQAKNLDGLSILEKILVLAVGDSLGGGENTWQLAPYGKIQLGPKEAFNKPQFRRMEIYDVTDLLFEVETYDEVPEIDLQQALAGGGGGGRSPFTGGAGDGDERRDRRRERRQQLVEEIQTLVKSLVEKDQWEPIGRGGTITPYQGAFIVDAPDYLHRALVGYPWWPSAKGSAASRARRYVGVNQTFEVSRVVELAPFTTTGTAGGTNGGGGAGGTGGGSSR